MDSITTDLETARQNAEAAELAKVTADEELAETRAALEASQADKDKLQDLGEVWVSPQLIIVRISLTAQQAAKTIGAEQDALIETLRGQIQTLQHEFDEAQENLEALRVAHANDSSIAAAAEIDRQALAKAKEDLETIEAEKATLKGAYDEALNSAAEKTSALELQASRVEALDVEVASLQAKQEETSTKLTELEVEIMESKDALELAEGELGKSKDQIEALRAEIAKLVDAADSALQGATAKEKAAAEHLEGVQKQHTDALALAVEDSKNLAEQLRVLQVETDALRSNLEAANAMTASAVEEHARKLEEVEKVHQAQREELAAEKDRIAAELEVRGWLDCLYSPNGSDRIILGTRICVQCQGSDGQRRAQSAPARSFRTRKGESSLMPRLMHTQ